MSFNISVHCSEQAQESLVTVTMLHMFKNLLLLLNHAALIHMSLMLSFLSFKYFNRHVSHWNYASYVYASYIDKIHMPHMLRIPYILHMFHIIHSYASFSFLMEYFCNSILFYTSRCINSNPQRNPVMTLLMDSACFKVIKLSCFIK